MTLKSIHLLLTYTCNFECDHCFLYCSPRASGTFTLSQIKEVISQVKKVTSISNIGFEGGEPFLFYPLLVEAVRLCSAQELATAIQTNNYWALDLDDAVLWLEPLAQAGLTTLEVSSDDFHHGSEPSQTVRNAVAAAKEIGLMTNELCIKKPKVSFKDKAEKGVPIYQGGPKLRGRAAEILVQGLPTRPWEEFTECPYENLADPARVHLDAFGNIHLCQGLCMGNIWETPLHRLLREYDPRAHPICGPLLKGGPAQLARNYNIRHHEDSVDACHFCTRTCKALINRFPRYLTPGQVYGIPPDE